MKARLIAIQAIPPTATLYTGRQELDPLSSMEPDLPGDVAGDESDDDGRGLGGLRADGTVPSGDSTGVAELAGMGAPGVMLPLSGDGTGAEGEI